jgi:hypothetical protein
MITLSRGAGVVMCLMASGIVTGGESLAQARDGVSLQVQQALHALDRSETERVKRLNDLEFLPGPATRFDGRVSPPRVIRACVVPPNTPAAAIDPHRSLMVRDRATLDAVDSSATPPFTNAFALRKTLKQLADQVATTVPNTTAVSIFRQLWDTQDPGPGVTNGPHCGNDLNGFPIACPRAERREAIGTDAMVDARLDDYKPLALVNRLDLAHEGWRNCGEHRIIYGKRAGAIEKNLIIFEAVLPNPRPGCREGCAPVADFWASLSSVDDPVTRAKSLENFFYKGLPGFRPVVHVDHYSAVGVSSTYGSSGSGQIRTNQFLEMPWLLKEFKTVIDCGVTPCTFALVPIMVKVNPHGELWNEDNGDPLAIAFRAQTSTPGQLARLGASSLSGIGYAVELPHDAGQSRSQAPPPPPSPGPDFVDNYRERMNAATATGFRTTLGSGSLSADQMANRAMTQTCAGCHQPSSFGLDAAGSIGVVTTPPGSNAPTIDHWPGPVSAGFVHVDVMPPGGFAAVQPELAANAAAFGSGRGQEISEALLGFFLPDRKNQLLGNLNATRCDCVNRFIFLPQSVRQRALAIAARVDLQFRPRLDALGARILESQMSGGGPKTIADAFQERSMLIAERDRMLALELKRADIHPPDEQGSDLTPHTMKLAAARVPDNDATKVSALRAQEINDILRREPPRRTVTGSFRSH